LTGTPLGLYTDLYELTMAASFHREGRTETATFDLFVRSLPARRDFLVVAGIDTAVDRLAAFTYDDAAVEYLGTLGLFDDDFLAWLATFRFSGEVRAILPGELAFAGEPIVTVTAPLVHAQLLETLLINTVGLETMIASKAARVHQACAGRSFVDFSARRDHGLEAALAVARASAIGGAAATSLVEAGRRYGLALSGTMAHSFVMAHDDEVGAFRAYLRQYGPGSILLVDTYDTTAGVRAAVAAMRAEGVVARAVRIDSGDLAALAIEARAILDDAGFAGVQVLASGDLDEDRIAALVRAGVPIDAFGVGTQLGTSADAPYLGMVYKLVEQGGEPRLKLSPGKHTAPGRKQVWRADGTDTIALAGEPGPTGARPLLEVVYDDGPTGAAGTLADARGRCLAALASWPGAPPAVEVSDGLAALARGAVAAHRWVGSTGA
jgi:nicotinate phosphoribosyltransferase